MQATRLHDGLNHLLTHFGNQRYPATLPSSKASAPLLTVAQILPEMHSGGVERGTLEVAQALVAAGHRSIVISNGGRLVDSLQENGSEHITMPVGRKSLRTLGLIRPLRRLLKAEGVDVLHARSRVPAWLSRLTLRGMPNPPSFITTVHGLNSVNWFSRVMTSGDRVICVSNTVRKYVLENYPEVDGSKLSVIHRGVDPAEYHRNFRASFDWERRFRDELGLGNRPIVVLAGRLTRLKGHHDFLAVMEQLRELKTDAVGIIVGGVDPRREAYANEIKVAADSCENVVLAGHRGDLREIMSISAAVVSLSQKPESFGRTVLESLALGVPVVGYNHGGVSEILNTLYPRGSVDVGDVDTAADRLVKVLRQHESDDIAENSGFTLKKMRESLLQIYNAVGSRNPSRIVEGEAA